MKNNPILKLLLEGFEDLLKMHGNVAFIGTGFHIKVKNKKSGEVMSVIVTNKHVCKPFIARKVPVEVNNFFGGSDQKEKLGIVAERFKVYDKADICLLGGFFQGYSDRTVLKLDTVKVAKTSENTIPGSEVFAIGYVAAKLRLVNFGKYITSLVVREPGTRRLSRPAYKTVYHTAKTIPGMSGGVVVNSEGEVIAITTMAGYNKEGYATGIEELHDFLSELGLEAL